MMVSAAAFFSGFCLVASRATTPPQFRAMTDGTGAAESLMEARRVYSEQATLVQGPAYAASQQLFFEQRRVAKRGPPTPAFSSTGLATPTGDTFGPTAPTASGSTPPATQDTGLFQPMHYQQETAFVATAHSAGVNANNPTDMALWMKETISTRAQVLDTIRHYHTAVMRQHWSRWTIDYYANPRS